MSWTVLIPAFAVLVAMAVLTWSMARIGTETAALRASLRRTRATAVAADEMGRTSRRVAADLAAVEHEARNRVRRPRPHHPHR